MKLFDSFRALFRPGSDLYVLGSSILWGQGHPAAAKIDRKVAGFIGSEFEERPRVHLLAHSGALLDGDPSSPPESVHGEVPTPWPSVLAQLHAAPAPRSDRIRVLLEGGINDVGGVRISSPATPPEYLEKATERACYHDFKRLLEAVFARFPRAEVYVLGYYQILAERTVRKDVEDMLDREGLPPVDDDDFDLAERAIGNSRLFRERSDFWLAKACREAGPSCTFVEAGFDADEGMFGKPSLLFHPWSNDPMMGLRARKCTLALARRKTGLHCFLAATAHPNEAGIDRYVANLIGAMRETAARRKRGPNFSPR
ncbi:SGNH/GDSL hydrolase family protein [Luteolibacter marinus]|uniref:SGNH/GDSL hydrolase family protein n=1 Tax=Luteolibacter marinus TaxID=2776705 RepID=UPI001865E109|nr:SGNH/GDSL hydrolase family protein [Luteolibacter marinus]